MFNTMSRSIETTKHRLLSNDSSNLKRKEFMSKEGVENIQAEYEQPRIPPLPVPSKINLDYWKNLIQESRKNSAKGKVLLKIKTKEIGIGATSKTFEAYNTTDDKSMVIKIDLKVLEGDASDHQEKAM